VCRFSDDPENLAKNTKRVAGKKVKMKRPLLSMALLSME
jgi:hypothetical protein